MFQLIFKAQWLAVLIVVALSAPGYGAEVHRWAWGQQKVNNNGGDSRLNVWKPNGRFSLSQHWYVGGSESKKQTVEGGWQVFPERYGTSDPVLFIYYTPDNYATKCYNLDCGAFVQIDNSWVIGGGSLSPQSSNGGKQYIIRMQWQLYKGNWWLFVQGAGDYVAVGYYPGSVFNGGQMSKNAEYVKYGGETASDDSGKTGEMGSGQFANASWSHAAYQRTIYYIDTSLTSHWANLDAHQTDASCYTIDMHNNAAGSWATHFYFGGPKCP